MGPWQPLLMADAGLPGLGDLNWDFRESDRTPDRKPHYRTYRPSSLKAQPQDLTAKAHGKGKGKRARRRKGGA